MTEQEPLLTAERSDASPFDAPKASAVGAERVQSTGAVASWEGIKRQFGPMVRAAGLEAIPEPDSAEFPHFLAKLNAVNRPLSLELVAATRRLRQEVDLPSSRASERRERRRATRRFLFMRHTPDGRWVADKTKAPLYGILGLLITGGLLTAMYAMPRLAGTSAFASKAQTASPVVQEEGPITPGKPSAASEAALSTSREDLARFRSEQAAKNSEAAKPLVTPRTKADSGGSSGADPITGGLVGGAARSTAFQPLSSEPNPPAPPTVQERSVQTPGSTPPAVFSPVPSAPTPAPQTYTPPVTPSPPGTSFGGFEPTPLPISSAPVRVMPTPVPVSTPALMASTTAARPIAMPRPAAARPISNTATAVRAPARTTEVRDVDASFGALPVMPSPLDAAPVAGASGASPTVAATSAVSALPFGNVQDPAPVTTPLPADTSAFSSGVVYERASTPATSGAANSGAAGTLAAETPFGSDASTPASEIGATGPFKPLQQVPALLMTAIRTLNGGSVPVVAVTQDGGSFVGLATINATLARVDMQFRRFIAADGKIYTVDALAYSRETNGLTQGLAAEIRPVAPTLALDATQNSANALNTYVQNAASATVKAGQGTSINLGDNVTLSGPSVATLAQTLLGGLGSTFRMPENTQSITRMATVSGSAPMIVIAGLGGEGR